ncbi:hydroxymethylglutaryl-CoA lyase [Sporichthya polymorpha]|uniref:hydroxymethylglutaryl-CoA lyase n=1 Tax=Sporichthya polymorpha TaxID=35751 RepID=UPI00035E30CD|nr:hydroxymethylglutaryl-CoA lyase [Sporichthya polymorpha]
MTASTEKAPRDLVLTEVGLRDGLQLEAATIPTTVKIELAVAFDQAGYRRIEVGSFVSPRAVPSMADTGAVMDALRGRVRAELQVLAANVRGVEQAAAAGADVVNIVVATTETMNARNAGCTVDEAVGIVEKASGRGDELRVAAIIATAFACPYEGPVEPEVSLGLVDRVVAAGATRVTLADTVGAAHPAAVAQLVARTRERHPGLDLGFHAHDTRGMGLVNALAAVEAGVDGLDSSLGGLGGCPFAGKGAAGNVASEEVIGALDDLGRPPGVDLDRIAACSAHLEDLLGRSLPSRRLALFRATGTAR